jgi:ribosomal protein S18 acetylase RimI-like enzyme
VPVPEIRPATDADAAGLLDLWARAEAVPSVTDDADGLAGAIAQGTVLVAVEDGRVVGSVIAAFDGWRGNMYRLAVDPDVRRRGLARALVAEGEHRLVAQGCRRITALVVAAEDHATAFWAAAGYAHDARINRFVKTAD